MCLVGGSLRGDTSRLEGLSCTDPHKQERRDYTVFTFLDYLLGLSEFLENQDPHLATVQEGTQQMVLRASVR